MNLHAPSPVVFMFSGQGSQYYQMGQKLYASGGTFARCMDFLDNLVVEKSGRSVLAALYGGYKKSDPFVDTQLTHPAIFMLEVALAYELIGCGIQPDLTLGVSMGTFAAAVVAGGIRVEDALTLVVEQADSFVESCSQGGMIAVLADAKLYRQASLDLYSVIASYNFESHFVLSAKTKELAKVEEILHRCGVAFQHLPVEFAYHSPWIEEARSFFERVTRGVRVGSTNIPLLCCATLDTFTEFPAGFFWEAVRRPVRFQDTVTGLEAKQSYRYIDLGPAGTLVTFLKYLLPRGTRSTFNSILSPYGSDSENLGAFIAAFNGGLS